MHTSLVSILRNRVNKRRLQSKLFPGHCGLGFAPKLDSVATAIVVPLSLEGEYLGLGVEFAQLPRLRVVALTEGGSAHELGCSVAPVLLKSAALAELLSREHHCAKGIENWQGLAETGPSKQDRSGRLRRSSLNC